MLALILSVLICGGLGAVLGCFHQRSSGVRPLIANCQRSALYGALFGVVFYFLTGVGDSAALNQSTPNVTRIDEREFEAEVIHSTKPVVVDFYATWCGPCKVLSPMLDKLAGSFTNEIKFVKINVDEAPDLSQRLGIQGLPALWFFKNGTVVGAYAGLLPSDTLKARLESLAEMNASAGDSR
ncbi:MAG TPA: thioredoxin [Verrucomicrobiae bacterium]|nr:thioredoxin [Verrucomicrobiae bacterium]